MPFVLPMYALENIYEVKSNNELGAGYPKLEKRA